MAAPPPSTALSGLDTLSDAEKELLEIAARLHQAMIYRDKNEIDENWYIQSIEEELVSFFTSSVLFFH
jgi:hypothetical protein